MTRREHPQLRTSAMILTYLASEYPAATRRIDLLAAQPWPADVMAGSTSGGDISDPTGNTATTLQATWLGKLDDMDGMAQQIVHLINRFDQMVKDVPHMVNTQRLAEQQTCTGGSGEKGADDWGSGKCDNIADRLTGHNAGLCSNHIRYRNDWERKQRDKAA